MNIWIYYKVQPEQWEQGVKAYFQHAAGLCATLTASSPYTVISISI